MYREDSEAPARHALLARVRIATPCDASWDAMAGDDRVRHCGLCDRKVYDLSRLSSAEAVELLREHEGERMPCVRLHRRRDGTLITGDCARGASRRKRRLVIAAAAACAVVAGSRSAPILHAMTPPPRDRGVHVRDSTMGQPYVGPETDRGIPATVHQPFLGDAPLDPADREP